MDLGRAEQQFDTDPEAARATVAEALGQTRETLDELRALSRGIAPPILVDRGLQAALTALAGRCTVPVDLDVAAAAPGSTRPSSTTAYFVVAEALTNVAKHSQATEAQVSVRPSASGLLVTVADDGVGGAQPGEGPRPGRPVRPGARGRRRAGDRQPRRRRTPPSGRCRLPTLTSMAACGW